MFHLLIVHLFVCDIYLVTVFSFICLCSVLCSGKPFPYMPYEMKMALEQEAQSGRPGSPYRLSPRDMSKASPQPNDPNASRYSVPPGNRRLLCPPPCGLSSTV